MGKTGKYFLMLLAGAALAGTVGFIMGSSSQSEVAQKNVMTPGDSIVAGAELTRIWDYGPCGHDESEVSDMPKEYIGMKRTELASAEPGARITFFSAGSVKLKYSVNDYCTKHVLAELSEQRITLRRGSHRGESAEQITVVELSEEETLAAQAAFSGEIHVFSSEQDAYAWLWDSGIRRLVY